MSGNIRMHIHHNDDDGDDQFKVCPDNPGPPDNDVDVNIESTNPLNFDGGFNVKELLRLLHNKVDKIHGKSLTTNDFTDFYKNILDNLSGHLEQDLIDLINSGAVDQEIINVIEQHLGDLTGLVHDTLKINGHALTQDINLNKNDIGLGNVDNTADLNKPISNATQHALDTKQDTITTGDITESSSDVLSITGGLDSVIGQGVSIEVKKASTTQDGYLSAQDFSSFSDPTVYREIFESIQDQTIITLQNTPRTNKEVVHLNGLVVYPGINYDYTITNNIITFSYILEEGERIMVTYS